MKHDQGKAPMSLLDRHALEQIAAVLGFGAKKYAAHNWRGGIAYSRLLDAALRHLMAFADGEDLDPESGLPHVAHAGCCIMFLLGMMNTRADLDDRYKAPGIEVVELPVEVIEPAPLYTDLKREAIAAGKCGAASVAVMCRECTRDDSPCKAVQNNG